MASKKTLNQDNLAALGPERLAAILIEVAVLGAKVRAFRRSLSGA